MLRLLGKVLHVRVNQIYCLVTFKQIERHDYNTWFAVLYTLQGVVTFTAFWCNLPHVIVLNHLITFYFNNLTFIYYRDLREKLDTYAPEQNKLCQCE